jgi:translation initiation factor IF-2
MLHFQVSAKSGFDVDELFTTIATHTEEHLQRTGHTKLEMSVDSSLRPIHRCY